MSRYIKLSDAIKQIESLQDCYNGFSDTYDKACIIGALEEIPTVDAVPVVHGHWVNRNVINTDDAPDLLIEKWQEEECSVCRRWHTTPYFYSFSKYAYCPWCGAKMDLEVTENG